MKYVDLFKQTHGWLEKKIEIERPNEYTETSSPCVCQPPIATEWDQISRPFAFHT